MGTSCKEMNREKCIEIGFCALLYVTAPFITAGTGEISAVSLAFRLLFPLCFLLRNIGLPASAEVGRKGTNETESDDKVVCGATDNDTCGIRVGRGTYIACIILYAVGLAALIWLKPMQGTALWGICLLLDLIRCCKKQGCGNLVASIAVLVPASLPLYRLLRYLLTGAAWREDLYLGSIQSAGYTFAEYFTTYTNRAGHPGLGLSLLAGGVLCFLFLLLGDFQKATREMAGSSLLLAILLCLPAGIHFPWDILQRVAAPIYRAIALLESSGVFLPAAGAALLPACALAFRRLRRSDEAFLRDILPALWAFATAVSCIYRICGH